jgi:hypothetical protein
MNLEDFHYFVNAYFRMLKFWSSDNCILQSCYNELVLNSTKFVNWATCIRNLLFNLGMNDLILIFIIIQMHLFNLGCFMCAPNFTTIQGPEWLNELGSWNYLTTHTSLSPIRRGFVPGFVNYKNGALVYLYLILCLVYLIPMCAVS